jgi:hypothetical protein
VDDIAGPPFQAPQCFRASSLGDLALVVGAAVALLVPDLVMAAIWIAWLRQRLPRSDS